ncbi:MAG: hypothetical protein ACTHK7_23260 [Aureliella sp.]
MKFGVTVWCFLLSYLIVAVLEYSRLAFPFRSRPLWLIGAMSLGWLTHTMFLADRLWFDMPAQGVLSSWFQWALLVAWGIASLYLLLLIRRPENAFGTFILPLLLASIGLALGLRNSEPFERETTVSLWRTIHAISLLLATMVITVGMATGLMYLVHSYRLKRKLKSRRGFRLPSLEYLQSLNRPCLFISFAMLAVGLLSGIVMNLNRDGHVAWLSSGILFTFALCAWSLAAVIIELTTYRAFGGKRTAYLTIANFVFLALVLGFVLLSPNQHAGETHTAKGREPLTINDQGAGPRCIG